MAAIFLLQSSTLAEPGPRRGGGDEKWDKDRIETIIIGKFATELELSTEQAEKFFPRFRTFRGEIEQVHKDERARTDKLMELGDGGDGGQAALNLLLAEQQASMNRIATLKSTFLSDVSNYLDPAQTARCAILLDEVPRKMREMIDDRRDGGPRSGSPRGPRNRR